MKNAALRLRQLLRQERTAIALWALVITTAAWHVWYVQFFCDDSFISYRYAENLASGKGLVFNEGERVEGYTNFLWVILLALGLKLGWMPAGFSLFLGALSLLGILGTTFLLARIVLPVDHRQAAILPIALLAFQGPLALWCTSGMESGLFTWMVLLSLLQYENSRASRIRSCATGGLYALATMVRPDGAVFGAAAGLHFLLEGLVPKAATMPRRQLMVRGGLVLGGFAALFVPFMLWRRSYYGDWLPNTFYVKASSAIQSELGSRYLTIFAREYWPLTAITALGVCVSLFHRRLKPMRSALCHFVLSMFAYLAYVGWAGGDYMALYRFVVPVLPIAAILASVALVEAARLLPLERWVRRPSLRAALQVLLVGALGATQIPPTLQSVRGERPAEMISSQAQMKRNSFLWSKAGQALGRLMPPGTTIATTAAGAIPYWSKLPSIDQSGLCDRYTAKVKSDPWMLDRPGHNKQATKAHLEDLKPELILWHPQIADATTLMAPSPVENYLPRSMPIDGLTVQGRKQFLYFYLRKDLDQKFRTFGVKPPGQHIVPR